MKFVQTVFQASFLAILALAGTTEAWAQDIETIAGNGDFGAAGDGGPATAAALGRPTAVLATQDGGFYIAASRMVRHVDASGVIRHVAGTGGYGFEGDGGPATAAKFVEIEGMALDAAGNLFLADSGNGRVRRIDTQGRISTFAGDGQSSFSSEPGPATQRGLYLPSALAIAADGSLLIAERYSIRKVDAGGYMEVIAGTGPQGEDGDNVPATTANLNVPDGLAVGADGSIYFTERNNRRLRRIRPDGVVTTLLPDVSASRLARDLAGNLYFNGVGGNQVSRYTPGGQVVPVAGTALGGFSGDGGPAVNAELSDPSGVSVDAQGRLLIADRGNNRIRRVGAAPAGVPGMRVQDATANEGNSGTAAAVFLVTLPGPASTPVVYDVATRDGTAQAPGDYQALAERRTIPVGQSQDQFTVRLQGDLVFEASETFSVDITAVSGATFPGGGLQATATGTVRNDDPATPTPKLIVRDDRHVIAANAPKLSVPALANDEFEAPLLAGGSLEIVSAPAQGTAAVVPAGQAGDVGDDRLSYSAPADWTGEARFTYRLCENTGRCANGVVVVVARPLGDRVLEAWGHKGNVSLEIANLPAMPGARFLTSPLVAPSRVIVTANGDPTPAQVWDNVAGIGWELRSIPPPADGRAMEWRVLVSDETGLPPSGTVLVGVDLDGNGIPSSGELRCTVSEVTRRCEMALSQSGRQGVAYWVAVQNRRLGTGAFKLDVYEVPMGAGNGSLTMTGPSRLGAREPFAATLAWDDATLISAGKRAGIVEVKSSEAVSLGESVLYFTGTGYYDEPIQLASGVPKKIRIGPRYDNIFIDVPAGATRLTVASASSGNIDFYLARRPPGETPVETWIEPAPAEGAAVAVANGATGNESLVVQGAQLQAGRWYVVPTSYHAGDVDVTLTATVLATAPVVRAGSYFNASRSGHGLFLHPAGNTLVGIWYTYREAFAGPTWYYLQGARPGANGLWTAKLYRGAWNGTTSSLTEVGKAILTPTAADAFVFSYTIDGVTGSEPMTALGRGCPSRGGAAVDISSHWFDPAHAGTGYSVQMFANYEFYTAFVYDSRGEPRFLVAERSGFGDDDEVLDLKQMSGYCPSCEFERAPVRTTVGTLRRRLSGGKLLDIELDAIFVPDEQQSVPVPGAWSSVDVLQLLGGAGTTQGCDP